MRSRGVMKGLFKPRHPEKYKGDPTGIVYRSSYELKLMRWLDSHPNVLRWSSEELAIPYKSPIDDAFHRYYPDVIAKIRDKEGKEKIVMMEVKPAVWCQAPAPMQPPHSKTYLREVYQWGVNSAKWAAAQAYCAKRGWHFQLMTEKGLGITNNFWGKVQQ